jgi:GH43 family beta-xylosidase
MNNEGETILNPTKRTFTNPILEPGADPYMVRHTDGFYYMMVTTNRNLVIWKSRTMSDIGQGERKVIWTAPEEGPTSKQVWAPELHFRDGKWYVYFAATDGHYTNRRMYVLENDSEDPFADRWVEKGKIAANPDRWAIDGTVLRRGEETYFVWSGWEGFEREAQRIYIARMSNPWTITGERVELSRPEYDWERVRRAEGMPYINEGPAMLYRNGRIFLVYSASMFHTDGYCLGMLTADESSDLMDPASWRKSPQPLFTTSVENRVFGPGHNSFVLSPDGTEDWIVYHAYPATTSEGGTVRSTRIQRFTWKPDGTPDFGVPIPNGVALEVPSGETEE